MGVRSTTWKHIRRSPYQAIAAILTLFLTFLLGGFFLLATTASELTLRYFESKPQITVFFTDRAGQKEADSLTKTLQNTGKVAKTKFINKDEALNIYKDQYKNDPLLLEMVTADILPASLEVSATDPNYLKELLPLIKQSDGVEDVVYQQDVVESMLSWSYAIRVVGLLLAGILAIDSILIVTTVVGMKIALRKEEVEILKLVGASPWYIRLPFVTEGAIYGTAGAFLAWTVLTLLIVWIRPNILTFLNIIPSIKWLFSDPLSIQFLLSSSGFMGGLILCGIVIGSIGSLVAVGRYLKF